MNGLIRSIVYTWIAIFCILAGFVGYIFFSVPDVRELKKKNPPTTAFIEYRKREAERRGEIFRVRHRWIPLKQVPKLLQRTIIVSEDASFWMHNGIDWHELNQAVRDSWKEHKFVRGASTITQQTAKNLYLSPQKSLYRKLKEFFIARAMEVHLSKSRILELYLNCIEFGDGIFGIGSASSYYFGKSPSRLTVSEMVRLAAIIPSPLQLDPTQPSTELKWRSNTILQRLFTYNFIDQYQYNQAKEELKNFFGYYTRAD